MSYTVRAGRTSSQTGTRDGVSRLNAIRASSKARIRHLPCRRIECQWDCHTEFKCLHVADRETNSQRNLQF
jgi:hypothetical protein